MGGRRPPAPRHRTSAPAAPPRPPSLQAPKPTLRAKKRRNAAALPARPALPGGGGPTAAPSHPRPAAGQAPRTAEEASRPAGIGERSGSGCGAAAPRAPPHRPGSPQAARQSICSGSFSKIGTCSKASCMMAGAPPGPATPQRPPTGERQGPREAPLSPGRRWGGTGGTAPTEAPPPAHSSPPFPAAPAPGPPPLPRPGAAPFPPSPRPSGGPGAGSAAPRRPPPPRGPCQGPGRLCRAPASQRSPPTSSTRPADVEQPAQAPGGSGRNGKRGSARPAPAAVAGALPVPEVTLVHLPTSPKRR